MGAAGAFEEGSVKVRGGAVGLSGGTHGLSLVTLPDCSFRFFKPQGA